MFVHENVHDKFVEKLKTVAEKRVVGDPFDESTTNGALISSVQFQRVLDYIKSGKSEVNKLIFFFVEYKILFINIKCSPLITYKNEFFFILNTVIIKREQNV